MARNGPNVWLVMPTNGSCWVIRYEDPDSGRTRQKSTKTAKKKEAERILGSSGRTS